MSAESPAVFDMPTLGRAVVLGELYDQRSGKFLGVQLYPQDKVQEIVTNIRNTNLSVSLSTTHEDRASLLDINARLSLDFAGGLIKVSGSASYLSDKKSNTNEYAYALALKMRLCEKRILFAEDGLGHAGVLPVAQEDYISTKLATHFVSSIVLGGNFIVNLVARKSELSKEQKIEGKLQLQFDKLKGVVSLDGEADAKAKEEFKHMNDKFDLTIHGDVALDKVPINPQDVLDTFPQAAALISDGGGVPVSVTLQPISPKLYKGGLVYKLNADFVDDVLKAFSMLDNISSRFSVLEDGTKTVREYVPELDRTARVVASAWTKEHNVLRHELGEFLQKYQRGEKPRSGTIFSGTAQSEDNEPIKDSDITGDKVLEKATKLHEKHLNPYLKKDVDISKQYRPSLAALENELLQFQYFALDVQRVRQSLQRTAPSPADAENLFYLSSIEDVSRAIRIQSEIPLFVTIPLTADELNPNLTVVQYLALLRRYATYFNNPLSPGHMLYGENLDNLDLKLSLPKSGIFSTIEAPSLFIGTVDEIGNLTWRLAEDPSLDPPTPLAHTLSLDLNLNKPLTESVSFNIDPVDCTKSFSVQVLLRRTKTSDPAPFFYLEYYATQTSRFLEFVGQPFSIMLGKTGAGAVDLGGSKSLDPPNNETFTGTFVQDTAAKRWFLYLNDEEIANESFTDNVFLPNETKLRINYNKDKEWYASEVFVAKFFTRALRKEEIEGSTL